jgi:hypothetical protein
LIKLVGFSGLIIVNMVQKPRDRACEIFAI